MASTLARSFLLSFLFLLFTPYLAPAETKTFIKEYTYQASDYDSKISSRTIALEQVKRLLLEEVGTYLISETDVKNFQLAKDKITTLTAGIIQAEMLDEKWDGKTYYLKAKMSVAPQDVKKFLEELRENSLKNRELVETNRKVDEALNRIKQLQADLTTGQYLGSKQNEYSKAVAELKAKEWIDKGVAFMNVENYEGALSAFNNAVEIDPASSSTYIYLGGVLNALGDYGQAVTKLNRATDLDPKNPWIYLHRAGSYMMLGNYQQAYLDAEKAISLDVTMAYAYAIRGWAYSCLGNLDRALADLNKSLQMDPNNPLVYIFRAWAYNAQGNKRLALNDFNKSLNIAPNNSIVLWNIAAFHVLSGEKEKSLQELGKAVRMNSALKKLAKTNASFQLLWNDTEFKKLVE
ncbi:MAG: tetratricopeptide repeat protein [Smithellaceae bacterium]